MIIKEIALNLWEENHVLIRTVRGETDSRKLKVSFIDQEANILNLSNKTVTLYAKKPDGTQIYNNCDVDTSTNTVIATITSQMISSLGIVECEFQIFDSKNILLKVNGLKLLVTSKCDFSEAIESTSEYNALISALNKIPTIEQGVWNPILTCPKNVNPTYTASYTNSHYYRIGNLIYITFFIHANITNIGSGSAYIDGLPFTAAKNTDRQAISLSVKGFFSDNTSLTVIDSHTYLKIGNIDGSDQSWKTGQLYIGGSGCYLKQ